MIKTLTLNRVFVFIQLYEYIIHARQALPKMRIESRNISQSTSFLFVVENYSAHTETKVFSNCQAKGDLRLTLGEHQENYIQNAFFLQA